MSILSNIPASAVPIILMGRNNAPLVGPTYKWDGRPEDLLPKYELRDNALYFIQGLTISADINELDYQAAISTVPQINFYQTGQARTPLLRKPVFVPIYLQDFNFVYPFYPRQSPNELLVSVKGELVQTPALIGKASISITSIITMYEITDDNWVKAFRRSRA